MKQEPLVSILMNCYNGACYLREAIDSVMGQTYRKWELIFWDNQSTDNSASICRSYDDSRIRYFRALNHTNLGAARALALQQAKGEFIAVLDTDDLWLPRKLELQVPMFVCPEVGIVIADTIFFDGSGQERQLYKLSPPPQGYVFRELITRYFVSLETVILRKRAVDSLNQSFDPALSHISDMDLIVRLSRDWKLSYVPQVLAKWRVHADSGSWQEPERFMLEKRQFARKMDSLYPRDDSDWQQAKNAFLRDIAISGATASLIKGDKAECRKNLSSFTLDSWKTIVLYLISFVPVLVSAALIKAYRRTRSINAK